MKFVKGRAFVRSRVVFRPDSVGKGLLHKVAVNTFISNISTADLQNALKRFFDSDKMTIDK